jgi:hypothetical protein
LDYIYQQLGQLNVVKQLPNVNIDSDPLINRAMDVQTAVLNYLTAHINHESKHFGTLGTFALFCKVSFVGAVMTTFVVGPDDCQAATDDLGKAINYFNVCLANYNTTLAFHSYDILAGNTFHQVR